MGPYSRYVRCVIVRSILSTPQSLTYYTENWKLNWRTRKLKQYTYIMNKFLISTLTFSPTPLLHFCRWGTPSNRKHDSRQTRWSKDLVPRKRLRTLPHLHRDYDSRLLLAPGARRPSRRTFLRTDGGKRTVVPRDPSWSVLHFLKANSRLPTPQWFRHRSCGSWSIQVPSGRTVYHFHFRSTVGFHLAKMSFDESLVKVLVSTTSTSVPWSCPTPGPHSVFV